MKKAKSFKAKIRSKKNMNFECGCFDEELVGRADWKLRLDFTFFLVSKIYNFLETISKKK